MLEGGVLLWALVTSAPVDDGVDDAIGLNAQLKEVLAELEADTPHQEESGEPGERMERAVALNARLKAMLAEAEGRALDGYSLE